MIRAFQLVMTVSVFMSSLAAQVNERDLRRSYSTAQDGTFLIEPGLKLKGLFDKQGRACAFTLHGEVSEAQVFRNLDVLVPPTSRGLKKQDMIQCVGSCERVTVYENVKLTTGTVGHQVSEPAAIVTFNRSECRSAIAKINEIVLHIKR